MKNQFDLKYALFLQLHLLLLKNGESLNKIGLTAGVHPMIMHRIMGGYPVCWRHYFKLLNYLGYDLEIKLVPKSSSLSSSA